MAMSEEIRMLGLPKAKKLAHQMVGRAHLVKLVVDHREMLCNSKRGLKGSEQGVVLDDVMECFHDPTQ